ADGRPRVAGAALAVRRARGDAALLALELGPGHGGVGAGRGTRRRERLVTLRATASRGARGACVKASLVVVLVLGSIVMLFLARRRLWLALKLTAGAFVALNLVRFFQQREDTDRFVTLGLAIGAFAACWGVL